MRNRNSHNAVDAGIDSVSPEFLKNLVAWYKCTDYKNDGVLKDSSVNGYDLSLVCAKAGNNIGDDVCGATSQVAVKNGYMHMTDGFTFVRDVAGTLLDTQNRVVIFGCEFAYFDSSVAYDSDLGTEWQGEPNVTNDAAPFDGFQYQNIAGLVAARIVDNYDLVLNGAAAVHSVGDTSSLCAAFIPSGDLISTSVVYDSFGNEKSVVNVTDTDPASPASLVAQNGKFGLRATKDNILPFRNYHVWAFDTVPQFLEQTVRWMAKNPGKIPPNLIGKQL